MMIEVYPNLFVGSAADLIHVDDGNKGIKPEWYVITAAKDPWHREALGYSGRAAPKDHPEYLMARRGDRLIMNLIDANDAAYVPQQLVDVALADITSALANGKKVLIHCNQGQSRAPTIALLWLRQQSSWGAGSYEDVLALFRDRYPAYAPAKGMEDFARAAWTQPVDTTESVDKNENS